MLLMFETLRIASYQLSAKHTHIEMFLWTIAQTSSRQPSQLAQLAYMGATTKHVSVSPLTMIK